MAKDNYRGKKQPQLKIVDDNDPVPRLDREPEKSAAPKKKAHLRRTHEVDAMSRNLADGGPTTGPSQEFSAGDDDNQAASPLPSAAPLRIPPAFLILAAVAFLLLLGIGIFLALGGRDRDSRHLVQERSRENLAAALQEREDARDIVAAMTTTLQSYTSARTVEEMLPFVRQPERVEPLMRKYYQTHPLVPEDGAELQSQFALPLESSSFVILNAGFPDSPNRIFLAEVDNDLQIRIDWESDACYLPVEIADYIAEKPTDPVDLRVFASPDNFYVYEFVDSDKYQCFKLTFRDNEELLFGYVERDSPTGQQLIRHFQNVRQSGSFMPEPLYLKVKFLENSKSEQGVLIEEFIAPRWANIEERSQ